jgi:transcriptional regulator with XRE-family HTH domain
MPLIRDWVAENLKYYRTLSHLSQERLAEMAGLSSGMIGKIEAKISSPSLESLFNISQALGIEPYLLIRDPESRSEYQDSQLESIISEFRTFLSTRNRS